MNIDDYYIYDGEFDPSMTATTLVVVLDRPALSKRPTQGRGIKILPPKWLLQRLLILLAQIRAGSSSENLLNETRQTVYLLYQAKEISKRYTIIY